MVDKITISMERFQIIKIAYDYIGSISWLVLSFVALAYLLYRANKKQRIGIIVVFGVSFVLLYNDLSRILIGEIYDESYYRFFWLIPFVIIDALALTIFLCEKGRVKKWQKALVILVVAVVLATTNKNFFDVYLDMPGNFWLLSRDVFPMSEIIEREKEEDRPTIIFPEELEYNYRTYDSSCQYAIFRDEYEKFIANGYVAPDRDLEDYDDFVLANTVTNHVAMSPAEFKTAVVHKQVDFLVVHIDDNLRPYFENVGFELVGNTYNYQVYKYKYNYYDVARNAEEADKRLAEAGIHVDDVVIELKYRNKLNINRSEANDEENESNISNANNTNNKHTKILVVNDLHTIVSDSSVVEESRAKVDERLNWACNETGAKSLDSFMALTTGLDYADADAIYYAGDIFDYQSYTGGDFYVKYHNLLKDETKSKITYLRADHDIGNWYTGGAQTDEDTLTIQLANTASWQNGYIKDYGNFVVVGWNNSTSGIADPEFLQQAVDTIYGSKPVILITHVPLDSKVNSVIHDAAASVDDKGRIKLWGGDDSLYIADGLTQMLLDAVYDENGMCQAVIAGHLHIETAAPLTNTCMEYIRDAAFKGNVTRFIIE